MKVSYFPDVCACDTHVETPAAATQQHVLPVPSPRGVDHHSMHPQSKTLTTVEMLVIVCAFRGIFILPGWSGRAAGYCGGTRILLLASMSNSQLAVCFVYSPRGRHAPGEQFTFSHRR